MPSVTNWKLRRLSSRALQVLERHKHAEPAIAAYEPTLVAAADRFIEAYDEARAHRTSRIQAVGEGRGTVDTLLRKMRGWVGILVKDVPGFEGGSYGDTPAVPDDVIHDAVNLLRVVDRHAQGEPPLPYAEALRADLVPLIEASQAEWKQAGTSVTMSTALQAEVRAAAEAFHVELVAFRRTLRAHIASGHPDYQKLRTAKATATDQDDDEVAASLPDTAEEEADAAASDDDDNVTADMARSA